MNGLLRKGSVLILLGSGGVGKTTVAAALGLAAASSRLNTALITVDPAPRLRDALGLRRLGGEPTRLSERALRSAGLDPSLQLAAMQLDVKGAWDRMVERMVRNPATRRRILENPFYRSLTASYAGSEAYAALAQLYDLHQTAAFAIEIVDTPPAAHAFEFLQAPARLLRLLDSPAGRWLFAPPLSAGARAIRLASQAARFVVRELERFAGANVLANIADFFAAASEAADAMIERLHKTEALLRSRAVRFILVTTAEADRLRAARELVREMAKQGLELSAIVVNRFLEEEIWADVLQNRAAEPRHLAGIRRLRVALRADLERTHGLDGLVRYLEDYRRRALDDIARVEKFATELPSHVTLAVAPEIEIGAQDLAALSRMAQFLVGAPPAPGRPRREGTVRQTESVSRRSTRS